MQVARHRLPGAKVAFIISTLWTVLAAGRLKVATVRAPVRPPSPRPPAWQGSSARPPLLEHHDQFVGGHRDPLAERQAVSCRLGRHRGQVAQAQAGLRAFRSRSNARLLGAVSTRPPETARRGTAAGPGPVRGPPAPSALAGRPGGDMDHVDADHRLERPAGQVRGGARIEAHRLRRFFKPAVSARRRCLSGRPGRWASSAPAAWPTP